MAMNEIINLAIEDCKNQIQNEPYRILSEGDFERLLANCLEKGIKEQYKDTDKMYVVHTQISHYPDNTDNAKVDARVDILIMDENERKECDKHNKAYTYAAHSYAFELKYLHNNNDVNRIENDLEKVNSLAPQSDLYVIALLDKKDDSIVNKIDKMYHKKYDSYTHKSKLHYNLLFKCE